MPKRVDDLLGILYVTYAKQKCTSLKEILYYDIYHNTSKVRYIIGGMNTLINKDEMFKLLYDIIHRYKRDDRSTFMFCRLTGLWERNWERDQDKQLSRNDLVLYG